MRRIKARTENHNCKYITNLIHWSQKDSNNVCSLREEVELLFEDTYPTLENFVNYRKAKQEYFNIDEILYVVRSCLEGLRYLQGLG